jgi:hypothetical protein
MIRTSILEKSFIPVHLSIGFKGLLMTTEMMGDQLSHQLATQTVADD